MGRFRPALRAILLASLLAGSFVLSSAQSARFKVAGTVVEKGSDEPVVMASVVLKELGLRGATAGAFGVAPRVGIAVDVGFATEVPGISADQYGELIMGKGPGLSRNADNNPVLLSRIMKTGDRKKIPYQLETGHRATGGTDTAAIQLSRGGVATALFSIPNRYMHTPVEICDLRDVEAAAKLIAETVASLSPDDNFRPGID